LHPPLLRGCRIEKARPSLATLLSEVPSTAPLSTSGAAENSNRIFDNSKLRLSRLTHGKIVRLAQDFEPGRVSGSADLEPDETDPVANGNSEKRYEALESVGARDLRLGKTEVVEKVRPLKPKLFGNTHSWLEM
jgi:hypothetical protein